VPLWKGFHANHAWIFRSNSCCVGRGEQFWNESGVLYVKNTMRTLAIGIAAVCLLGAVIPNCGGLRASDFKQVNVNGFDAEDNAVDANHYSYAMEYFRGDGADDGYIYVGTGNNIFNLVAFYIQTLIEGGDILDAPVRPPEIRRYRPDLGPTEWESVFDYRDVETDGNFRTIGFRFMTTLQLPDPDKQGGMSTYLYAATQGEVSVLWRSKTGNPGEWEKAFQFDTFSNSIRWIEQHDGRVYLAVAYDSFGDTPPPGEIWASDDGVNFVPVMQDGFGDLDNRGTQALISYNGWVYAGTKNDVTGFEVWKFRPTNTEPAESAEYEFVKVVENGGPSAHNENAGMPIIFKNKLYIGTQLYVGGINFQSGNGFQGCDIIRINEDDSWDTIVGPGSLSGYESGFNHFTNAYLWWMEEHDGWLYAGTMDNSTVLAGVIDQIDEVMAALAEIQEKDAVTDALSVLNAVLDLEHYWRMMHSGADLFKSPNGVDWYPVTLDGMGDPENYGWRTMKSAPDGYFYLGSANPAAGSEIWRAKSPGN
jgi:hypothetical protein